jgi:serine protease Do
MKCVELRRRPLRTFGVAAGVAAALGVVFAQLSPAQENAEPVSEPALAASMPALPGSFADVVERVSPAVVNIAVTQLARPTAGPAFGVPPGMRGMPPLEDFFGRYFEFEGPATSAEPRREGQGSGFLIDARGLVVTNHHVIDGADEITVTLNDGRQLAATLKGHDPKTDLALLQVETDAALPYVSFADSDRARVGDWVVAIGNPFGLGGTATAGIVSARGRDIRSGPYDDYLQIDAPINRGNSGGPVFNVNGEVMGVSTAIFSPNGGNIGIGFAIPANQARLVVDQLRDNGVVERGWLGIRIQDLDADLAASLELPSTSGALVADVDAGSPAHAAGFQPGDVITRFGSEPVASARSLSRAVGSARPGQETLVEVWREGRTRTLEVELGTDEQSASPAASTPPATLGDLGWELRALDEQARARLRLPPDVQGVVVARVAPNGSAAAKGVRPGDVVTEINRRRIGSVEEAREALAQASVQDPVLVVVRRGDAQRFVSLSRS